jgi:hypothetical protein
LWRAQEGSVPLGWNGGQEMMHRHNICILGKEKNEKNEESDGQESDDQ